MVTRTARNNELKQNIYRVYIANPTTIGLLWAKEQLLFSFIEYLFVPISSEDVPLSNIEVFYSLHMIGLCHRFSAKQTIGIYNQLSRWGVAAIFPFYIRLPGKWFVPARDCGAEATKGERGGGDLQKIDADREHEWPLADQQRIMANLIGLCGGFGERTSYGVRCLGSVSKSLRDGGGRGRFISEPFGCFDGLRCRIHKLVGGDNGIGSLTGNVGSRIDCALGLRGARPNFFQRAFGNQRLIASQAGIDAKNNHPADGGDKSGPLESIVLALLGAALAVWGVCHVLFKAPEHGMRAFIPGMALILVGWALGSVGVFWTLLQVF